MCIWGIWSPSRKARSNSPGNLELSTSRGIQVWIVEPPHSEMRMPTGIPSTFWSLTAKKYAAALVAATASGVFSFHEPVHSSRGLREGLRSIVHILMGVSGSAPMMNSADPFTGWALKPLTGISMLDCPEQNHTSPRRTFPMVVFSPSLTVML